MKSKKSRTTINLPAEVIKDLMKMYPEKTKTDIVRQALEHLRQVNRSIHFVGKYGGKMHIIGYE